MGEAESAPNPAAQSVRQSCLPVLFPAAEEAERGQTGGQHGQGGVRTFMPRTPPEPYAGPRLFLNI
jgi:hypothetical protein